jgi:cell wall-associated NlpC family hydrolase
VPCFSPTRFIRTPSRLIAALSVFVVATSFGAAAATANPGAPPATKVAAKPVDPKLHHRIDRVNAQLDRLTRKNAQLDEQYNVAAAAVTKAKRTAKRAQQAADRAEARYQAAHARFVQAETQQYEIGPNLSFGQLLTSQSPQQYIDGFATTQYLSSQFAATANAEQTMRVDAVQSKTRAATSLSVARTKAADLAKRRVQLRQQSHRFRQLLDSLTARQRRERAHAQAVATAQAQAQLGGTAPRPVPGAASGSVQQVIAFAEAQVGKAYSYGAAGPSAFDCSGLTMAAWAQAGVALPHSAAEQYNYGTHVAYSQLQPGDLIFLYSPIGHVELYVGNDLAVSAADPAQGIVYVHPSQDMGNYTGATRLTG